MNQVFIDARGSSVARPMTADSSRLFRRAVPVLIGLLLLARLIGMAVVPLMDTTEARYGETGRIMADLNDWITPWFDYGVPFWGKPPLAFWVTAASFKAFGVSEFTARLRCRGLCYCRSRLGAGARRSRPRRRRSWGRRRMA